MTDTNLGDLSNFTSNVLATQVSTLQNDLSTIASSSSGSSSTSKLIINDGQIHVDLDNLLETAYTSAISSGSDIDIAFNNTLVSKSFVSRPVKTNPNMSSKVVATREASFFLTIHNTVYYCGGTNTYGQFGNGTIIHTGINYPLLLLSSPGTPMTDISQVSCAELHTVFLKSSGIAFAVGNNNHGQLGNGTIIQTKDLPAEQRYAKIVIDANMKPLNDIKQVSCGYNHTVFLKSSGVAFACGYNYNCELANGTTISAGNGIPMPVLSSLGTIMTDISQVSCGDSFSAFLKSSGIAFACGVNNKGQLGNGTDVYTSSLSEKYPTAVLSDSNTPMTDISQISCGSSSHIVFIKKSGVAFACGWNSNGQLGNGTTTDTSSLSEKYPTAVLFDSNTPLDDISRVSAGKNHTIFIKNSGVAFGCGYNSQSQLGIGTTSSDVLFASALVSSAYQTVMTNITDVACGMYHSLFLNSSGEVFGSGVGGSGRLGTGKTTNNYSYPGLVQSVVPKITGSDIDTRITTYGKSPKYKLGFYDPFNNTYINMGNELNNADIIKTAQGFGHAIIIITDVGGEFYAYSWGNNIYGERLHLNIFSGGFYGATQGIHNVACGNYHSVFMISENVHTCGLNSSGQLGNETYTDSNSLVPVSISGVPLSGIQNIFAGGNASFFVSSSLVYATGYNEQGQLGINSTTNTSTPTSVQGVDGIGTLTASIKDIRVGNRHVMFLTNEGVGYASGANDVNQLGVVRSTTSSSTPVVIEELFEDGYNSRPITTPIQKIYTDSLSDKSILIF